MKTERKVFWISVVGMRYENSDGSSRMQNLLELTENDKLKLIREPDNPYDEYAVKVVYGDNLQIGYIPMTHSRIISSYLDGNYEYDIPNFLIERNVGYHITCGIKLIITPLL